MILYLHKSVQFFQSDSFIHVLGNSHKSQLQPSTKQRYMKYILNTKYINIRDKFKKKQTKRNTMKYTA
jgi:hypothetical protein